MKRIFFLLFITVPFLSFCQKRDQSKGFIENKGQIVDQDGKQNTAVKYLLNTPGLNVQLKKNGFSYDVYETKKVFLNAKEMAEQNVFPFPKGNNEEKADYKLEYHYHRIDIDFINSNVDVRLSAEDRLTDYDNYYNIISKPEGILNVSKYRKVIYAEIYPNIDVEFFIPEDESKPVEYNFIIRPNGKISDIVMRFNGAKTELIDNKIKVKVRFGEMEETLPLSWTGDDKKEVEISYKRISKNTYGFISNENLEGKKLIIDPTPTRLWGTYYNDGYNTNGIANDHLNNVYFCGATAITSNIATSGSYQSASMGGTEGFLVKFDVNGNRQWGTYYGGSNQDNFYSIKEKNGALILIGSSNSPTNIATPGAFKENLSIAPDAFGTLDCMIVKFDFNGQRIWGTYFGGESRDYPLAFDIDINGDIVVVGETYSINGIATPGTYKDTKQQPVEIHTTGEGFISKFNSLGTQIWGSYFGICEIRGVGTDAFGNIYFSGDANHESVNPYIATPGTHQLTVSDNPDTGSHNYDSYLAKFAPNGQRLWGTYFGGYGAEYNHCLKVDRNNDVYISGYTLSYNLIATPNAYQTTLNGIVQNPSDAYLAKFNPNGHIIWSTYYGGEKSEGSGRNIIDIDESNNVFLAGETESSTNIATPGALFENLSGVFACFVAKFSPQGARLWGTYFGGSISQFTDTMKYDKNGIFYVSGYTYSPDWIATPGAYQTVKNSSRNMFIEQFKDCQSVAQAAVNSPCLGDNLNLTASGGTGYSWTGPNGFTSNQQNPVISNAAVTHNGVYSCAITGTAGCDNTISITVAVGDTSKPIPNLAALPTINGDCNTIISIPTATDNCAGNITATTTDPLSYPLPGNYIIRWTYNDGNGNSETQNQNVTISAVNLPTVISPQKFCIQQNATLNDVAITGTNIKWYDAPTGGNRLPLTTVLQDGITYYATQTVSSCESLTESVTIQIQNTPTPTGTNQSFCAVQNATLNDIVVNGTAVKWYSNTTTTVELPATTVLADNITYYATQTVNGCESVGRLPLAIRLIYTLNAVNYSTFICDTANDGSENVNLSDYNSFLLNSAGTVFSYYNSNNGAQNQIAAEQFTANHSILNGLNKIYVRIDSTNGCHQVVELQLTLVNVPNIAIPDEIALCENKSITVNAGAGFDSYAWSNGASTPTIRISQAGNYSVTVTKNHGAVVCSSIKNFTVVLSYAPVINSIDTVDWTDNQNSITINTNTGDFEYSINGQNFQASNSFYGLANGEYTVTVRDKKGCGTTTKVVYLLNYPKFFTPNGDGYNDNWYIRFSSFEPNFKVSIFDRYGKLLKEMNNLEYWDGTHNGKPVPSDDYWFNVTRHNGKTHKGHFALKR